MDSYVRRLVEGSFFVFICRLFAAIVGFSVTLIVSKYYGPSVLGVVASISSAVTLLSLVSLLGTDTLSLRVFAVKTSKSWLRKAYWKFVSICLAGIISVMLLYLCITMSTGMSLLGSIHQYVELVFFLFVCAVYQKLNVSVLRGKGDVFYYSTIDLFAALVLLLAVSAAILISVDEQQFPYWYSASIISGLLYAIFGLKRVAYRGADDAALKDSEHSSYRNILSSSIPMLGATLSVTIITTTDILMLNYFLTSEIVGVYSVYVRLLMAITIVTNSVNAILAPQIARLFQCAERTHLKLHVKKSTAIVFLASLIPAALLIYFDELILSMFGEEFIMEKDAFKILVLSTVVNSGFGATGFFLNMTKHEKEFFFIMLASASLNVVLNLILIPIYGIYGAAASSLITVLIWNSMATLFIKKQFGYTLLFMPR